MNKDSWIITFFTVTTGIASTIAVYEYINHLKHHNNSAAGNNSAASFQPFNFFQNGFMGLFGTTKQTTAPVNQSQGNTGQPNNYAYTTVS